MGKQLMCIKICFLNNFEIAVWYSKLAFFFKTIWWIDWFKKNYLHFLGIQFTYFYFLLFSGLISGLFFYCSTGSFPYENESHRLYWVIVIVLGFRTDYRFRRNWVLLDLIVWFDLPWIIAINHIWLDLIVIILDFISSHFIAFNMIKFVWFWIRCYCMLLALIIFYRILFDLILLTFDFIGLNHIWSHWMLLHCSELESTVFYWMLANCILLDFIQHFILFDLIGLHVI